MKKRIFELKRKFSGIMSALRRPTMRKVLRYKQKLQAEANLWSAYPNVGFVFQTFNKGDQIRRILDPFVKLFPRNVILFADGCVDRTAINAHSVLAGPNHLVLLSNDTHEIRNYRVALSILSAWKCDYAILLQDDDLYADGVSQWIDSAVRRMVTDPSLAIIGGNGGLNLSSVSPKRGDAAMMRAHFEEWSSDDRTGCRLADYWEMEYSSARKTLNGSSCEYVAVVNRAPQVVRVAVALDLGFFPAEMEPFQDDDLYNCFRAWTHGYEVLHMPMAQKTSDVGRGGMRLYNSVGRQYRPQHTISNWNYVLDRFEHDWISGRIMHQVRKANRTNSDHIGGETQSPLARNQD